MNKPIVIEFLPLSTIFNPSYTLQDITLPKLSHPKIEAKRNKNLQATKGKIYQRKFSTEAA